MHYKTSLLFSLLAAFTIAACKNNSKPAGLIGHWKMTGYAVDANSNKNMDATELHKPEMQLSFSFLANGRGAIVDREHLVDSITWSLQEGDWLKQVDGSGKAWYYHMDSIAAKRIILRDTIEGTIWEVLEKE
jgi:hypothetical protein